MQQRSDQRFAELIGALSIRFDIIDRRFEMIDRRFDDMDRRFASTGSMADSPRSRGAADASRR
ncbi:hypothetical protein BH23GEM10_BH23GEM10_09160 [soil metagenome]